VTIRLRKSDLGKPIMVRFHDHATGLDHPVEFRAYGELSGFDRGCVCIRSWATDEKGINTDDTDAVIVRKTIIEMRRL